MAVISTPISLTSQWFIKLGCKPEVLIALDQLAKDVYANEPNTLTYLIHKPLEDDSRLQSLPPANTNSILFFEVYRDAHAFFDHVNGKVFTDFVKKYGNMFVDSKGNPFTFVEFLIRHAGFIRPSIPPTEVINTNEHPCVMFEVIAKNQSLLKDFYNQVFGWQYQLGTDNFAYIHFPTQPMPLLGGIGQANPNTNGFDPGHNFYLRVDDLAQAITKAVNAGGSEFAPPTIIDNYHFAMIKDPEGNPIGLIQPFI